MQNPEVERWLLNESRAVGRSASETLSQQMKTQLAEGLREGEGIPRLQKRLEGLAEEVVPRNAERIARTETGYAFREGARQGWAQSGVVVGKKWLLAPNACPFCRAIAAKFEGKAIGLHEPFARLGEKVAATVNGRTRTLNINYAGFMSGGGLQGPPLHPNCRCDTIAVLDETYAGGVQPTEALPT